jgi:hypothetical protein
MICFANPMAHPEDTIELLANAQETKSLHSLIGTRFCVKQRLP